MRSMRRGAFGVFALASWFALSAGVSAQVPDPEALRQAAQQRAEEARAGAGARAPVQAPAANAGGGGTARLQQAPVATGPGAGAVNRALNRNANANANANGNGQVGTAQAEPRVTICHREPQRQPETITVNANAVPAHLAHGDTLGPCPPGGGQPPGNGGNGDQVTICHREPQKQDVTITVDASALPAHLAHGDTLGPCPGTPPGGTPGEDQFLFCHLDPATNTATTLTLTEAQAAAHRAHGHVVLRGACPTAGGGTGGGGPVFRPVGTAAPLVTQPVVHPLVVPVPRIVPVVQPVVQKVVVPTQVQAARAAAPLALTGAAEVGMMMAFGLALVGVGTALCLYASGTVSRLIPRWAGVSRGGRGTAG